MSDVPKDDLKQSGYSRRRFIKLAALAAAALPAGSALLAACGDTATTAATTTAAAATTAATTAAGAATTTVATTVAGTTTVAAASGPVDYSKIGPELAAAMTGQYKGKTVSISHGLSGDEETKFTATFKDFQAKTGITIKLVPGSTVESINVKVQSGTVEDIVNFPQPGTMAGYAKQGKVIDLTKVISPDWLKTNYSQGFIDTNTVAGPNGNILGGVFERINFKGAVWYPKKAFDAAGYKVPTTWAEQKTLMDNIVKDGDAPWSFGMESSGATGWPATDWIEQIMLRTTSLDNYDKWTKGTLPFTDPIVKNAFQIFTDIFFNDKYVYGGRKAIVSTNFGDAPVPLVKDPPKAWLLNQGNFITTFFEKAKPGVKAGVDYDFYPLPAINTTNGAPVEYGGDLFSLFNDRPESRAVIQYFTTYEAIQPWIKAGGGAISPHKNSVLTDYTDDITRKMAQTILSANAVRFDGSDLMPAEVGSGSFWKGVTDYVSGTADLDTALATIQKGWSTVKS